MWKQEHEFRKDLETLARSMRTSLASLKDASPAMELGQWQEAYRGTSETHRGSLKIRGGIPVRKLGRDFWNVRLKNSSVVLKDFARAQFPKTLEDYGKRLKARRDNFREVISIQILRDTHEYSTLQTVVIFSLANDNTERTKRK